MDPSTDPVDALSPPLRVGERVSLRVAADDGVREVIGFVTALTPAQISLVDRRGTDHDLPRGAVVALRRVDVALGRRPDAAPRDLLDALASRAGVAGTPWVARISDLLAGRTPPAAVPARGEWATFDGVRARFEGEWVTLAAAPLSAVTDAAWWATRMGARSVQVRLPGGVDAAAWADAGFVAR